MRGGFTDCGKENKENNAVKLSVTTSFRTANTFDTTIRFKTCNVFWAERQCAFWNVLASIGISRIMANAVNCPVCVFAVRLGEARVSMIKAKAGANEKTLRTSALSTCVFTAKPFSEPETYSWKRPDWPRATPIPTSSAAWACFSTSPTITTKRSTVSGWVSPLNGADERRERSADVQELKKNWVWCSGRVIAAVSLVVPCSCCTLCSVTLQVSTLKVLHFKESRETPGLCKSSCCMMLKACSMQNFLFHKMFLNRDILVRCWWSGETVSTSQIIGRCASTSKLSQPTPGKRRNTDPR